MKTWLKYGVVLGMISLVLDLIDYISAIIFCPKVVGGIGCILPTRIIEIPFNIFGFSQPTNTILRVILTVLIWFIIGVIIGLIINKIKSKK